HASPITYDFTGTLNTPMNGTSQFSGSFTFNADPTASDLGILGLNATGTVLAFTPGAPLLPASPIAEYGSNVSLTLNVAGQVMQYTNTPQNPTLARFTAGRVSTTEPMTPQSGQSGTTNSIPNVWNTYDQVMIQGMGTTRNPGNSFTNGSVTMTFQSPTGTDPVYANLS